METLYICLDESGNLHHTSTDRFFLIGGFITNNALKARSLYKESISEYKKNNGIKDTEEVKGSSVTNGKKKKIIDNIKIKMNKNNFFEECFIVVDKRNLRKPISETNILYNYFIKILLEKLYCSGKIKDKKIVLKIDNKTIKVGSLNSLNEYLVGEFYFKSISIEKILYENSALKGEIQLADMICNYNWRLFKANAIGNVNDLHENIVLFPKSTFLK